MADTNKRSGGVKNTDYVNYDWNGSGENTNYVNSIKVLNSLKKVVTMAIHSTETVIPNMKNDKFVEILKQQVGRYTEFAKRCDELADKIGSTLEEKFGAGQFFAKASIKMKMLADDSVSKSAEMIILGSTNGIVELGKLLRHTPEINPETMTLARDVIEYLEQIIEDMKFYVLSTKAGQVLFGFRIFFNFCKLRPRFFAASKEIRPRPPLRQAAV